VTTFFDPAFCKAGGDPKHFFDALAMSEREDRKACQERQWLHMVAQCFHKLRLVWLLMEKRNLLGGGPSARVSADDWPLIIFNAPGCDWLHEVSFLVPEPPTIYCWIGAGEQLAPVRFIQIHSDPSFWYCIVMYCADF
jgi:hypothetical protein